MLGPVAVLVVAAQPVDAAAQEVAADPDTPALTVGVAVPASRLLNSNSERLTYC